MATPLDALVSLLDLEVIEVNIFRGHSPEENAVRVFGGQVAGQSLVAASRTVDEPSRHVHSLHAYFLRPGDPSAPILYQFERPLEYDCGYIIVHLFLVPPNVNDITFDQCRP